MRKLLMFVVMICCLGLMACASKETITEEYTEEIFESSSGTETVIASDEEKISDEHITGENEAEESEPDSDVNGEANEADELINSDKKEEPVSFEQLLTAEGLTEEDQLELERFKTVFENTTKLHLWTEAETDEGMMSLHQVPNYYGIEAPGFTKLTQYVLVDVTGDGKKELVMNLSDMGGCVLVICEENGNYYMSYQGFRHIVRVYEDGLLMGTSAASVYSYHRLSFANGVFRDEIIAHYDAEYYELEDHESEIIFDGFVNGEPATLEEFATWEGANVSNEVIWYNVEKDRFKVPISEEEMRRLVDANYNCVSNIFEVRLDGDRTAATGGGIPVTDDDFATYAELETYIREIFVREQANYLLYRYSDGLPTYWEADGVFYMRDELCGGGPCFGCPWESYTIEEYAVDGTQCAFTVLVKYPEDIAPENVKEERYYFTATYADGWKLDSMVCKPGEGATGHSREADYVYVDEQKLISEKDALDIAYNFYYGNSDVKEYSVYCEELPYLMTEDRSYLQKLLGRSYAGTAKTGYVIYQVAGENGMEREKYDPANPSPEKDKWILYSLGSTENGSYYIFWLYQYVSDGDGEYHLTTGDYCIVSYDGSVVVSERNDSMGNEIADTMEYNDLEVYLNY